MNLQAGTTGLNRAWGLGQLRVEELGLEAVLRGCRYVSGIKGTSKDPGVVHALPSAAALPLPAFKKRVLACAKLLEPKTPNPKTLNPVIGAFQGSEL